jgi:hypothetical protein
VRNEFSDNPDLSHEKRYTEGINPLNLRFGYWEDVIILAGLAVAYRLIALGFCIYLNRRK